jgi:hypothetical protein
MSLTVRSVSGLSTASASPSFSATAAGMPRLRRCGGSIPPSVMLTITLISAMPSAMQWCMRVTLALPPS